MNGVEFNEGDLVEAVKGGTVIRGRVCWVDAAVFALGGLPFFPRAEWTVTVIEKAKPKLPEEPGTVIRFRGEFAAWQLFPSGQWLNAAEGRAGEMSSAELLDVYGYDFDVLAVQS